VNVWWAKRDRDEVDVTRREGASKSSKVRRKAGELRDTTVEWVTRRDGVGCGERGQTAG
jgi:hypothetical protein